MGIGGVNNRNETTQPKPVAEQQPQTPAAPNTVQPEVAAPVADVFDDTAPATDSAALSGETARPIAEDPQVADDSQAEGWPEGITTTQAESMESLGITATDVEQGLAAVPDLVAAAEAAVEGDAAGVMEHLGRAAQTAPDLVSKAVSRLAADLPDGPLKTAITDPAFATLAGQLAQGDLAGAAETLQNSPTLLDAAGDLILGLPQVEAALTAAGIDPSKLPDVSAVLPDVLNLAQAVQDRDVGAATEAALSLASQLDPEAFSGLAEGFLAQLPDGARQVLEGILSNPDVQQVAQDLLGDPNFPTLVEQLASGDFSGAIETLSQNTELLNTAGDLLLKIPQVQELLATAGIDPEQLPELGAVLPDALKLAQAVRDHDVKGATEAALALASQLEPEAFRGLADKVLAQLPDGARQVLEGILNDPNVQQLATDLLSDPNFPTLVEQLASGDFAGALETLGENTALLDTVGNALADIPQVQQLLSDLGIDASKLPNLGEVLPDLLKIGDAIGQGDPAAALTAALELAGKVDLEAFRGLYENLSEHLPPEVKSFLDGIINDPAFSLENLQAAAQGVPDLIEGLELAGEGRWDEALDAFGRAAQAGSPLVAHAISRMADGLEDGPVKQLLQDEALVSNLIRTAPEVVKQLRNGDLAGAMAAIEGNPELMSALQESPVVSQMLTDLGIPEDLQDEAIASAPSIVAAMDAAGRGDWETVVSELREVAGQSPGIVGYLGTRLGESLPEGPVRDLLSNGELLSAALSDEALHENLRQVLSGEDVVGGLSGLLQNDTVAQAAWQVLGPQLSQLGLTGPEDLKAIGGALPQLASAVEALQAGDIPGALEQLHQALQQAAPELIDGIVSRAIDALPIDEAYKGILKSGIELLRSPEGSAALSGMWEAMTAQPPNVEAFGQALAQLGTAIGTTFANQPEKAEAFLNAMGALPGKIGALFRDPELNHAMAHSGALGHLFGAAEDLVNGRFTDAVTKLGDAAMALLGDPPSVEGLENFARLFRQVYEALPNAVKNKIQAAVASAAGSLFGNIPIVGDLFDVGKDIKELIDEMQAGDQLGTILAAAQLGIDAAKMTQVGKPFVAPLEMALGIVQGLEDAVDTIEEIRSELGNIMLLGQDDTPELDIDQGEREYLQIVSPMAAEYGMTPEQMMAFVEAHPEFRGRNAQSAWGLIAAANAAGVPPERFEEFLATLTSQGVSLEDIAFGMETQRYHSSMAGKHEANANLLETVLDSPATVQFLHELGLDPVSRLVDEVYQQHLGRLPTADEKARAVERLHQGHAEDDYMGYHFARQEIESWIFETDEYEAYYQQTL